MVFRWLAYRIRGLTTKNTEINREKNGDKMTKWGKNALDLAIVSDSLWLMDWQNQDN